MRKQEKPETFGEVVRGSGSSEGLIRRYDKLNLIECTRDPYGRRIFPAGTAAKVRALKAQRLAKRGPRRKSAR